MRKIYQFLPQVLSFFLFHGITYGGSDVIIVMAVDFCRHLLGKTLMNVMV